MRITGIAFLLLMLHSGCDKGLAGTEKTPNQIILELLSAQTWELTELTIDGVYSTRYPGMTLLIGQGTYLTSGGAPIWPASGTWEFQGDDGKAFVRDDGLVVNIEAANIVGAIIVPSNPYWEQVAANVILSFYWEKTEFEGSRLTGQQGKHIMKFKRKV
jgi:hypothetical protein